MILEDQRALHEDLERLEQAIADRSLENTKNIRDRLVRDHQIARFLQRIEDQSTRLIDIYADQDGARMREIQTISTGDPFDAFYKELSSIKEHHRRYPNEPVENLERAYKRKPGDELVVAMQNEIDGFFTGEEGHGRFFDLNASYDEYLNLLGVKGTKRLTYLQYIDVFDVFVPPKCQIKRHDKMKDSYFKYVGNLAQYLEDFIRKTKPLEDLDRVFAGFDKEFEEAWENDQVPGWSKEAGGAGEQTSATVTEGSGEGVWCADCEKEFSSTGLYKGHLNGKKHQRAVKERQVRGGSDTNGTGTSDAKNNNIHRLKERAIADREFRIGKLANAMQTERADTRVNVERRQGMTDRERQQELAAIFADDPEGPSAPQGEADADSDGEERIYNPLKLPLAWDGKPIPFWLYKLHGLGVEFKCEICGNFVYMGRRAFDKHFSEGRHIYGLKCLGITNTSLFREITKIDDAIKLWDKYQRDKKMDKNRGDNVVQMEDADGNVMPEKVYYDLQKQGLL